MAWLVAFNDGLFDQARIDDVPALLTALLHHVLQAGITLEQERERWTQLVSAFFQEQQHESAA